MYYLYVCICVYEVVLICVVRSMCDCIVIFTILGKISKTIYYIYL